MSESVLYSDPSPGVRLITINRPEARNAIGPAESRALFDFLGRFRDDDEANVLVITGAGTEAFCAGADLKSVVAIFDPDTDLEPLYDPSDLDAAPIPAEGNIGPTRWTGINKPVIAAVNGAAYAGGLEWACLAHIRIADQHASFGVTCRRWNVGLGDGGTQRLPRMIGHSRALDLIITGKVIGAAEAERIGLVNEVTESGRCLDRALDLAADISALPQPALRTDLEAALRGFGRPLEEGLEIERERFNSLLDQPEIKTGSKQFVERDHPDRVTGAAPLYLPAKAYAFAERAHRGQPGRHGVGDFIEHPTRVARITVENGGDEWAEAAAYLHDTVEKADTAPDEIETGFGPDMLELVTALGQDPTISDRAERRSDHRHRVAIAGEAARLVYLSDRLAGIEVMIERIEAGDDPAELETERRLGLWRGDVEALSGKSPPPGLVAEISDRLDALERLIT
ncbi:MAG: Enoyl-CoA hydratase/isomerase family protein [Actinomycetota bacterium]|jgi:enoyl-CoA hydratase|nr:Enoyl-CoA hydratase/isomerase family protein [Actinomycetota bacterium]